MKIETQTSKEDNLNTGQLNNSTATTLIDNSINPDSGENSDLTLTSKEESEIFKVDSHQTGNRNINSSQNSASPFKISYWEHIALMITPGLTGIGALIAIGISGYELYTHLSIRESMNMISHLFWLGSSINGVSYGGYKLYKSYYHAIKQKDEKNTLEK